MHNAVALYDSQTLRSIEASAAVALGDAYTLMQRAGQAGWRQLLATWPQAQRIVVICGGGNNGGDGYLLAMHALQGGRVTEVVRLTAPRSALAQRACIAFEAAGGRCVGFPGTLPTADVVVDALFGIGLVDAPDAAAAALIAAVNAGDGPVLSLDVPSGVDADRGAVRGAAVRATVTLQFLGPHAGLLTGAAIDYRGHREVAALDCAPGDDAASARALHEDALAGWLQPRQRDSHKGRNGHVLCIGGDEGSAGAIAMCADAALRSGAGLVSVATRMGHVGALIARRPEAMVAGVEDPLALQPLFERADVVAIGPGLGKQVWGAALWRAALGSGKALILDADALNLLAMHPQEVRADTILTPHPGEAARLLDVATKEVQADRYSAARALVERFACVVVLKGAGTIVAAPGQVPSVIDAGNPGMAVGGMGDLLTGAIAALRAQGLDAFAAASCGALLHAIAGDAAACEGGERGLLPSDLLPHLRRFANPGHSR
jgi:ADP-dependent NAD(P)H-hydrate dehydratase / NAD(P)H-hydrate epimerase